MPTYYPNDKDKETRRRAGLLSDEFLPGETDVDDPAGGLNAAGTPGGGLASGGLAGTNAGDGGVDEGELTNAMNSGTFDNNGDNVDEQEPESGRSGGAAGGTPAGKRAGPRGHDKT